MKMNLNRILKLIIAIVVCNAAGFIGSLFTAQSVSTWYTALNRPVFTPPGWLFAPVWTALYILMGITLFLLWEKGLDRKEVKTALAFFFIQLVLNALWSVLFFGLKSPFYAFIELIVLWTMILLTIITAYKVSKPSAYLLLPYIIWTSFAAVLNLAIVLLN